MSDLEDKFKQLSNETATPSAVNNWLRIQADENKHHRNQKLLDIMHIAMCVTVFIAALCIISMGVIWVWHITTPFKWLEEDQLDTIKNTLFSGAIGGLIAERLRKIN